MSADPTAEHIEREPASIVGEFIDDEAMMATGRSIGVVASFRIATALLAEPTMHAALAASLPAEVMLAALVDRGTLTAEDAPIARHGGYEHTHWQQRWDGQHTHEGRRFVTPWEVAP